jgi:methyl-accepting chemotaxis protein
MLSNLSIRSRLILIISAMSFLAVALSGLGLFGIQYSNDRLQTVYVDRLVPLKDLKIIADMYAVNIVDTTHKVRNGNISWDGAIKNVEDAEMMIDNKWAAYLATVLVADEEKLVAEIKPLFDSTKIKIDKLQTILQQKNQEAVADFSINELYPAIDPISGKFSELIDIQIVVAKQEYDAAQALYRVILIASIITSLLGLISSFFVGRAIIQSITRSVNDAQKIAVAIADGDLNSRIVIESNDEISVLLHAMQMMQDKLNALVKDIEKIVSAAVKGDFSHKIDTSDKKGYAKDISNSLNRLSEITDTGLHDVIRVADALSKGDLNQKITKSYSGLFELTATGVNTTVDALAKIVNEIQSMVDAAANRGEFSYKMNLNDKVGYTKTIAESLNRLSNVTDSGLKDVLRVANALAQGDLTQTIDNNYPGVFGKVKEGVNTTTENLKNLMSEIQEITVIISSASTEIAAGNNDLAHRTEEQAASLEETASSMQELTSTVHHNSDNAKQANSLASGATEIANKGVLVVEEVVSTMANINQSSLRIVDIISVIDDIAFQTNILALNAAVEAARAGEQGKGFAVVAIEVRNLAQRAANAAGEIKRLIGDSVERVSGGSKQVADAGQTMEDIVIAIQEMANIIADITSASIEQSTGISQAGQAISSMDDVTQQNAALVEQIAASSESLEEQAKNLATQLAYFKTGNTNNASYLVSKSPSRSKSVPVKSSAIMPKASVAKVSDKEAISLVGDDWEEF